MSSVKKTPRSRKSASKVSALLKVGKPRFHLRRGEPIGEELKTIARLHLEKALDELSGNNVSPEPVHEARTSIKKVRAVIQLASPALGSVRRNLISELLHDAAMRLAPLRDSEVQVETLDHILEADGLMPGDFSSLRSGLADIAKQRRANDIRQIPRVRGFLEEALRAVKAWPLEPLQGKDVNRRIRRIYRRGRSLLELCQVSDDQDEFHTFRKTVKQLWYSIRITSRFWPEEGEDLIQELGLMGELAGKERDFSLLAETLRLGPVNKASQRLIAMLESELPKLRQATLTSATAFYDQRPKSFVEHLDL
jgi:CHAD domain-containing protein